MREFWEDQAKKCGEGIAAVNFNSLSDEIANPVFGELVRDGLNVADVGCGNGMNIIELAMKRPGGNFAGFDFAESMVEVAEARRQRMNLANVRFATFDATADAPPAGTAGRFDVVIGKRLLINIRGPAKRQALSNIHAMLRDGGSYIMSECFMEPLGRINDVRASLGLDRITVKPFNEYLTLDFLPEMTEFFDFQRVIDVESLYYFISRVFNAHLSAGKPEYDAPINQLAVRLAKMGVQPMQGFSPQYIHVLTKRAVTR